MRASILTSTAAVNGLLPLRWLAFSQAAGNAFSPLVASFVPLTITVYAQEGGGKYPDYAYQFGVAGTLPAWVQPGVGINLKASVSINNKSLNLSGYFIIKSVDAGGTYFVVNAPSPSASRDVAAITQALALTNLDNGAGLVLTPSVSLVMQAQKAMFGALNGSVIIAPVVDAGGNAPDQETITAGQGQYEITAPTGFKFDLADWSVKQNGGPATLYVRFL